MDEFTKKPEIIFIQYEEIIKSPYPFLLKQVIKQFREVYDNFLNLDSIPYDDDYNLMRFCLQRSEKNIFRYIAKKEFNFEKSLNDLNNRYDNLYLDSELLSIGDSIHMLLSQKFTEKIYMYTPSYDKRIHCDINMVFGDMNKIKYITGPFDEVITSLNDVTTYILNDIMDLTTIVGLDKSKYTNIMIANYGYNYTLDENDKFCLRINPESISEENIFKCVTFNPIKLTNKHFSGL